VLRPPHSKMNPTSQPVEQQVSNQASRCRALTSRRSRNYCTWITWKL